MTAPEREFPAESVLLDRGRYATLGAEKRTHLRLLRDDMEIVSDLCRVILRAAQEPIERTSFARPELEIAEERLRAAKIRLGELARLEPLMVELKKTAWGREKVDTE